jgi:hypothetical protein
VMPIPSPIQIHGFDNALEPEDVEDAS